MPERLRFERELSDLDLSQVERQVSEPAQPWKGEVSDQPHVLVVDEKDELIGEGEYVFHQGKLATHAKFNQTGKGCAYFGNVDPARPFIFEVLDRVCAIRVGAFIDPDDPKIQYGGTWFDWTLVRDNRHPDTSFWPYYRQEMDDLALAGMEMLGRGRVERFMQHEHLTRRPIQIAKPFLTQLSKVQIRAVPVQIRVGPLVRYVDHERAVIWLETVTPAMVCVRCRPATGGEEKPSYASTVRVGGRYFAAVEIGRLAEEAFNIYTIQLAPLPAVGAIPIKPEEFSGLFPKLTPAVLRSMKDQLKSVSLDKTEWLTFRTLRQKYHEHLRFATGSCRWYPGDKKDNKDWGPDMLDGLGRWLRVSANRKDQWPSFLFFGGDQIYADEIGDDHGEMLIKSRFAARIPGPIDSTTSLSGKLIDGAWAGRFAHRYKPYNDSDTAFVERVTSDLNALKEFYRKYPEIKHLYHRYPKSEVSAKEQRVLAHQLMQGLTWALGGKVSDQRTYDKALDILKTVDKLNIRSGSYRAFLPHWETGFSIALRRNPMRRRYLSHNFLLWEIPNFESLVPTVVNSQTKAFVAPNVRGHLAAAEGRHAADFSEYAYLYERAWTSTHNVRVLLGQIPTFLMLDDHEVTDDWNFDVSWVRMLHNEKDDFRMWPKTLTDSLAAYWMYQGWCNKAPSQWSSNDLRVKALADAQRTGFDALPELRNCIYKACFMRVPSKDSKAQFQTGTSLDWHYKLPFDPPFLVPDCRTRKFMVPTDDDLRIIDHDDPKKRPMSQTIDNGQLAWMRDILVEKSRNNSVVFLAPSTPLLMPMKVTQIMMKPEIAAEAWDQKNIPGIAAALLNSSALGASSNVLLRVFRRSTDLEHMIRDKSWRDLWKLVEAMRMAGSSVKTLVLVSGDVHHNYCMTGNFSDGSRPKPEFLQITCSGLQTTIRSSLDKGVAELQSSLAWNEKFKVGKFTLKHGFLHKNPPGVPMGNPIGPSSISLYENAVAFVNVSMKSKVEIDVTYLAGESTYSYKYTPG